MILNISMIKKHQDCYRAKY